MNDVRIWLYIAIGSFGAALGVLWCAIMELVDKRGRK